MTIDKKVSLEAQLDIDLQSLLAKYGANALNQYYANSNVPLQFQSKIQAEINSLTDFSFEEIVNGFLQSEEFMAYKYSTKTTYVSQANVFLKYCDYKLTDGRNTKLADIKFKLFLKEYVSETENTNTRNKKCVFLRSVIKVVLPEQINEGKFRLQDFLKIEADDSTEPKSFATEQVKELFTLAKQGSNNFRNYCLLWVLFGSGIRVGEVVNLTIGDVDPRNQDIWVVPMKKHYEQKVRRKINDIGLNVLLDYITFTYGDASDDPSIKERFIFSKDGGRTPLCIRAIQRITKNLIQIAKTIGEREKVKFSTHSCRHTFALHALAAGVDFYLISKLLGHSSVASTEKYLKVFDKQLVDAVNMHPFSEVKLERNSLEV